MKKAIIAILAMILLAGCGYLGEAPVEQIEFPPVEMVPYEIKEMGVRFEYPEGWIERDLLEEDSFHATFRPPMLNKSPEEFSSIYMQISHAPKGYNMVRDYPAYKEVSSTTTIMGNRLSRAEAITIGGEPALIYEYEPIRNRRYIEIIIIREREWDFSKRVYFSLVYYPGEEGLRDILMQIAESFRLMTDEEMGPMIPTNIKYRPLMKGVRHIGLNYTNNEFVMLMENSGNLALLDVTITIEGCKGSDSLERFPAGSKHEFRIECRPAWGKPFVGDYTFNYTELITERKMWAKSEIYTDWE